MERGAGFWIGWSGRHPDGPPEGYIEIRRQQTGRVKRSYSACYHFRMSLCFSAGNLQLFTRLGIVLGALSIPCIAPGIASAQSGTGSAVPNRAAIEETLKNLTRGRGIAEVAISPDGKRLAWTEGARGAEEILLAPLDNLSKTERLTAAAKPGQHCHDREIAWAPDSKALAFFSDCAQPGAEADLYLSRLDGSAPRRLTELNGYEQSPAFSQMERRWHFSTCRARPGRPALSRP